MVRNIKMGLMKKPSEFKKDRLAKLHEEETFYDLWSNEEEVGTVNCLNCSIIMKHYIILR